MRQIQYVPRSEYNDHYSGKFHVTLHLDQLVYRHPVLDKYKRVIGISVLLINLVLLYVIWNGYVADLYIKIRASTTPQTTAVITKVESVLVYKAVSKTYEGVKIFHYNIDYDYTVDEKTYTGHIYDYWKEYEVGDTLTIHYDPNKPSDNFFAKKSVESEFDKELYGNSKYPPGLNRPRRVYSIGKNVAVMSTVLIIYLIVVFTRFTIWGRFQTEKKYFENYGQLPKPKPHIYDVDTDTPKDEPLQKFDFYTDNNPMEQSGDHDFKFNPNYDSQDPTSDAPSFGTESQFDMNFSNAPTNNPYSGSSYGTQDTDPFNYDQDYATDDIFKNDDIYGGYSGSDEQ